MSKFSIQPMNERLFVDPIIKENITESGIIMAPSQKEPPTIGKVLAVDPVLDLIKVGDTVMYPPGSGVTLKVDSQEVLLLTKYDLIGKVI